MMGLLNTLLGVSFAIPVASVAAPVLTGIISCRGMTWVLSPFGISYGSPASVCPQAMPVMFTDILCKHLDVYRSWSDSNSVDRPSFGEE
jgi:hypothetical protein